MKFHAKKQVHWSVSKIAHSPILIDADFDDGDDK